MPDLINKLSTYAALLGVIGAIGGGFYAWGEFNTRLESLENVSYEATDLSGINDDIKELNEKINDRVNGLGSAHDEDYLSLLDTQAANYNELQDAIRSVSSLVETLKGDIHINKATLDYLDAKIEELKAEQSNPLLN